MDKYSIVTNPSNHDAESNSLSRNIRLVLKITLPLLLLLLMMTILGIMIDNNRFYEYDSRVEKNSVDKAGPSSSNLLQYKEGSIPSSIIVISHACSGSSATIKFVEKIIKAHGYVIRHGGQPFLQSHGIRMSEYKKARKDMIKSGMYDDNEPTFTEILNQAIINESKDAQLKGQVLLYKANSIADEIIETLKGLNATMTLTYRKNSLDKAICVIRDCFAKDKGFGYQVYTNGTKADLCFKRRSAGKSDEPVMAMISDAKELVRYIAKQDGKDEKLIKNKYSYFIKDIEDAAADEDLFSFEYTESQDTFDRNIDKWMAFLKPFRLNLNRDVVKNVLEPYRNTRKESLHSSVVYNMDTLRSALKGTKYEKFLKDDP